MKTAASPWSSVLLSRRRWTAGVFLASLLAFSAVDAGILAGQRFLADDPIWKDPDEAAVVKEPAAAGPGEFYDFLRNSIGTNLQSHATPAALNINTLGEVPDSSWFENRHGMRRLNLEELRRGPNSSDGPSDSGAWIVTSGKAEGRSPGFRIRDANGDVYLLKLDAAEHPEMASAAEVITTKFLYAAGYHVPENYLVYFHAEKLLLDPKATTQTAGGRKRRMNQSDLERVLGRSHRDAVGRYRAVASKLLQGRPLGPFQYSGTRSDDPNDIFAHEHRRELRGLRVIASWLNHDDVRSANTLDMLVDTGTHRYIRHYLIDFGSALGSGTLKPTDQRAGHEYILEMEPALKRLASLGIWQPEWTGIEYPDFPAIGRFEAGRFDPAEWKPEYPNPAFDNMQHADAFWAAQIVMSFTDDDIRAIVQTGRLTNPAAEQYLAQTLIERRDKIGRHWMTQINSAHAFRAAGGEHLAFRYLAAEYGFTPPPAGYRVQWFEYDNQQDTRKAATSEFVAFRSPIPIPPHFRRPDFRGYYGAEITSPQGSVVVFLRAAMPGAPHIVGIDRGMR